VRSSCEKRFACCFGEDLLQDDTNSSLSSVSESWVIAPVRFSYNPSFSVCFFSRNIIFLSQQISRNSVSACFFSESNGAVLKHMTQFAAYVQYLNYESSFLNHGKTMLISLTSMTWVQLYKTLNQLFIVLLTTIARISQFISHCQLPNVKKRNHKICM